SRRQSKNAFESPSYGTVQAVRAGVRGRPPMTVQSPQGLGVDGWPQTQPGAGAEPRRTPGGVGEGDSICASTILQENLYTFLYKIFWMTWQAGSAVVGCGSRSVRSGAALSSYFTRFWGRRASQEAIC